MTIEEEKKDHINPNHYKNSTSLECIEAMQLAFGREMVLHFCLCNAWKYIWRWKNKNGEEDLDKASWYVEYARNLINDSETSPSLCKYYNNLSEMSIYISKQKDHLEGTDDNNN